MNIYAKHINLPQNLQGKPTASAQLTLSPVAEKTDTAL